MVKKQEKVYLFVDGSNLYAGQYELFGPDSYLLFPRFIKQIEKHLQIRFDKILFYTSYSPKSGCPSKKEKLYLKNEALFYRSVRQTPEVIFLENVNVFQLLESTVIVFITFPSILICMIGHPFA